MTSHPAEYHKWPRQIAGDIAASLLTNSYSNHSFLNRTIPATRYFNELVWARWEISWTTIEKMQ